MRMSKRGKRALLQLLKQYQSSDDAPVEGEGALVSLEHTIEQVETSIERQPALQLFVAKGVVTAMVAGAPDAEAVEARRQRTYVVLARDAEGAVEDAVQQALGDAAVVSAFDGDFTAAPLNGNAYLAEEGASD